MKGQNTYNLAQAFHKKMYNNTLGLTPEDKAGLYVQYFELIKKAAYKGHIDGLCDMGQQYENISFLGIPNPMYNPKKCVYWYTKACQKGHADAHNNLSNFYEKGEGCEQNSSLSVELLRKSAKLGSVLGTKNYRMVLRRLNKAQKVVIT